ncbi:MAG: hypothetical protein GXO49_00390, partial [Chlorobi bacterium]|nr:hypothetical protein [Chlorobiota bacterium]
NDISLAKNYINKYPKGKHIYKVKKIYKKLKKQKEKEDYAEAKRINTSDVWQKFLNNYPNHWDRKNIKKRIISLKVDEIMQSNETGNLPSFSKTNYGHSAISTVTIHNDTGYELTVRYSGPSIKEIVIPKGKYKTTRLKSGSYKIAASAGGLNYAGTEDLSGNYTSKYYIVTTRY